MMALKKILETVPAERVVGTTDRFIRDLQYDSRRVEEGDAFIAVPGFQTDGHRFVEQAYRRGARVFFVEKDVRLPDDATIVLVKDIRRRMADFGQVFFNFPQRQLKFIGITGTNGKTTTAYLIHSILKQAQWKPGLITTVEYFDGKAWHTATRTTPESLDLYRLFSQMVRAGLKSVVMEVSSHALELHRVRGIPFLAGVFTNLGHDHLDFHHTMENYFLAKRKLFERFKENQKAVINLDDPYGRRIPEATEGEVFGYSFSDPEATVRYLAHRTVKNGMVVQLETPLGKLELETGLLGDFNIYNLLAAVTTAVSLGLNENYILEGIRAVRRIPGRCEQYITTQGLRIFVDYAHTPGALRNILKAVWETQPQNLIVVFGAGGDRDRQKRPLMGKAAEDFADRIILTNDNPRSEDPLEILEQIRQGIYDQSKVTVIPDRREAIRTALAQAGRHDAVVVAGKGHETYQEIAGKFHHFDDHEVIEKFLQEKGWELV